MPTLTDIDNRPVAVGKWPRLRKNAMSRRSGPVSNPMSGAHHRDWCNLENCVHSCDDSTNVCTDVLLRPELLQEFFPERAVSSNPLLEFCLDGGFGRKGLMGDCHQMADRKSSPPLLSHCSAVGSVVEGDNHDEFVTTLKRHVNGCDVNVQDQHGNTAIHLLIQGCSKDNFLTILDSIKILLDAKPNMSLTDFRYVDTPFTHVRVLMERGLVDESFILAELMLKHDYNKMEFDIDVNHFDANDRTLLSYATFAGDASLNMSRLLLNHGARIVPKRSSILRDRSTFTWLVRGIVQCQSLEREHRDTLSLVCHVMASTNVEAMRSHVLSTLVHLGHSSYTMGPIFAQLKTFAATFWTEPSPLVQKCRATIRQSLSVKRPSDMSEAMASLKLPPSLTQYLLLNDRK